MKTKLTFAALGALCLLSACGQSPKERTTGGAAAGAATGAAVGALAGPPGMAVGALVGGGAGAATGATTSPQQVNLGKPPWTNPETRVPTPHGSVSPASSARTGNDSDRLNDQSLQAAQGGSSNP
jgi:phage tail tape-measure protein